MAYLSQNHCLENLEFTMEASRYRESYQEFARQLPGSPVVIDTPGIQHLRMLWQRLLSAYVTPGAPREINLPSAVRDDLLRHANATMPPPPETLDSAVRRIYDLMQESIFLPFLNTYSASASVLPLSAPLYAGDDTAASFPFPDFGDSTAVKRTRTRGKRPSPDPYMRELAASPPMPSSGHSSSRASFPLSAVTTKGKSSGRITGRVSPTYFDSNSPVLTDDSGSFHSHASSGEPMTPPTTPSSAQSSLSQSPKSRMDLPWKKMGKKLGFKR